MYSDAIKQTVTLLLGLDRLVLDQLKVNILLTILMNESISNEICVITLLQVI